MNAPMTAQFTDEQRLNAILHMEGMPAELPLLVDSPAYEEAPQEAEPEHYSAHAEVQAALSLDDATPVDTFIAAQAPIDYRYGE